jgi:PAS domain S-box-containing protein
MEELQDFRENLKARISLLRKQIESAGLSGDLHVPPGEDDLHELAELLNTLIATQRENQQQRSAVPIKQHHESARWEWDPANDKINVSVGLIKLFGIEHSAGEKNLDDILKSVFHSDRKKVQAELHQAFTEGRSFNLYYRITTSDNTMRFVHSRGKVLRNSKGDKHRMIGTVQDVTEQVIEENKYHILLETSPDAIITTDELGNIKDWNNRATEYFGWSESQVTAKSFIDLLLEEDHRALFRDAITRYNQTGDAKQITLKHEVEALRNDGSRFPAELTISAIRLESSHLFLIFIRDISELKIGENLLREKDELYRTVVESLFEGLIITDTSDRITYVNSQIEKLTGFTRADLIGKVEYEIFHSPALHESIRSRMKSRLDGRSENYELPFMRKDGSTFMAQVNAAPFRNAKGQIIGTVGAITDITARKREEELERLVIAATKSFNSLVITDKLGFIEWTNEGFTKLTGYTLEDVKGTRGEILKRSQEIGLVNQNQLLEELQKRKEPVSYESRSFTKSGAEFWTITTLTPVLDANQELEKIISIDSDITLRKKMEEQLKLANKIAENSLIKGNRALSELTLAKKTLEETMRTKEQFLAHISHEIRTPMNGILGLTNILLRTELSSEQREYLSAIKSSGDTLMVVINDILDLSKIEAGKMTFEEIPFKVSSIINPIFDLFTPKIREKNIRLIKNISNKVPAVLLGDPVRLNQIVMNLVSNAVKFTSQGYVEVLVDVVAESHDSARLSIKVKDTGPGIPKSQLHTLFVDFTQASADITRKYGGTGLGLSIAKRLVELLGGSVAVESTENEGSIFTITLDFRKPDFIVNLEDPVHSLTEKEQRTLQGVNVLLVEDNPVNQLLAEKLLSDWGCNISIADNGKIAIEKLSEKSYDIVLMDIKMPEMDGYEATRYIRQKMSEKVRNVPIIALTAHAALWEAEKCTDAGMNGYISKPFKIKDLYRMIAGNLNNSQPGDESNKFQGNPMNNNDHKYTDLTFLHSIAKGSSEFMNKIINSFIKQTSEEINNLQLYLGRKDYAGIHAAAHKIKPSLHFVGITELKDPIANTEKYAKERVNLDALPALVNQIVDICNKAIAELKQELDNMNQKTSHD